MKFHRSPLFILIRSWNSFQYFDQCVDSVFKQYFRDYTILFVDDCSEYTKDQKRHIKQRLKDHVVVFNSERKFSIRNAYETLHNYVTDDEAVIFNLDGDDYLRVPDALSAIFDVYDRSNCLLTYGECFIVNNWFLARFLPCRYVLSGRNIRYPKEVECSSSYRKMYFIPLHPRTWKMELFRKIHKESFQNNNGSWFTTCEDQAMFYPMLEMSGGRYQVIKKPLYYYRMGHSTSDKAINMSLQLRDEKEIQKKKPYQPIGQ